MAGTTKTRHATYNGKTYVLHFLGDTKFGRRAKLGFLDGSKEFWVAAALVTDVSKPPSRSGGYSPRAGRRNEDDRCEVCDGNKWTCGHCVGW